MRRLQYVVRLPGRDSTLEIGRPERSGSPWPGTNSDLRDLGVRDYTACRSLGCLDVRVPELYSAVQCMTMPQHDTKSDSL